MPLDRLNGEPFDDRPRNDAGEPTGPGLFYGARYIVIEPTDLFRHDIRVEFEPRNQKFRPVGTRRRYFRHILDDVIESAGEFFVSRGALVPMKGLALNEDDMLVQVYPDLLKVVVHVQRWIGGKEETAMIQYPRDGVLQPALIKTVLEGAGKKSLVRH